MDREKSNLICRIGSMVVYLLTTSLGVIFLLLAVSNVTSITEICLVLITGLMFFIWASLVKNDIYSGDEK